MPKVKIQPVAHTTLVEIVAGRLSSLILDGKLSSGEKLPPERELMSQLGVSRSTLREGLRSLAQHRLIEVKPGVGSFVRPLDRTNFAQATELALAHKTPGIKLSKPIPESGKLTIEPPAGPQPLRIRMQKPLRVPNLKTDRLGTFDFLSWWEREKVKEAKVMVVGAGALGNEVIKNLSLMGIGHLYIVDLDEIEAANLSRSVLFRERDNGRSKAQVAAAKVKSLNPEVNVQYLHGDVTTAVGLGVFRRMDAIVGCLDNREARLAVNRFCHWLNRPWVDGAIQELLGLTRVFVPGDGACYECTLTEQARREISFRYSCPLLARNNIMLGKVPTTPTIASIIGAMQSQETLKLIHEMEVQPGHVMHFNGMTNQMHTTRYMFRDDCESHWTYGDITELPNRSEDTNLAAMLEIARQDLGPDAILELDQELVLSLDCTKCETSEEVLRPLTDVSEREGHCPTCGEMRTVQMTHHVSGEESFIHRTLASIGVPPLHILRAHNGESYRFYELTGDMAEALHFNHFLSIDEGIPFPDDSTRIKLGPVQAPANNQAPNPAQGRIVFRD